MTNVFQPEELRRFQYLSWPALSRDGKKAAYVLKTPEEESGNFLPQVRWIATDSGAEHVLEGCCHAPVFLKNGTQLLCLSDRSGEDQIWCYDLADGSARQLTTLRHGVSRFALSEDETKLAFEAILWPEDLACPFVERSAEEKAAWEEELDLRPYYITELTYKMDEWYGMRKGEYPHLGILDLTTGAAEVLPLGMEAVYPAWSHDGSLLAFYGHPYHDARGRQVELFVWNPQKRDLTQITEGAGLYPDHAPIFTKDDQAVIGMAYVRDSVLEPCRIQLSDHSVEYLLAEDDQSLCHGVNLMTASRTENGAHGAYAVLSEDGNYLYFTSGYHARNNLYRVNIREKTPIEPVLEGETDLVAFSRNDQGELLYLMGTDKKPAELWFEGRQLTHHHDWLADYPQGKLEDFWIKSRDGKADLHYFLLHPVGQEEGRLYPAVLDIHGGPTTMYGTAYWHEFHALSAAGFAVIYGDPRGSVGYGREFCAGPVCWLPEAMNDLEDMLADAISKGFIDEKRVGVTGGSYGGYMTNKLIGRTKHFAAAVTQRSLVNPATSYGTGDQGFVSSREIPKHFKMLDELEDRARGNIISYIDNMKLPILILHAFKDYRCSFEQAEQLFIAMKERNPEIPCRLVMFPEENHGLTRTGKLHNQIRHLREMVDWFVKYLQKEEGQHETTA